jgi:rRNA maturation endonuclease Nob1
MKRYGGIGGIRDLFSLLSSSMSSTSNQSSPLKYYCMNCGKEHKEIACPDCGSKMKRVG